MSRGRPPRISLSVKAAILRGYDDGLSPTWLAQKYRVVRSYPALLAKRRKEKQNEDRP